MEELFERGCTGGMGRLIEDGYGGQYDVQHSLTQGTPSVARGTEGPSDECNLGTCSSTINVKNATDERGNAQNSCQDKILRDHVVEKKYIL